MMQSMMWLGDDQSFEDYRSTLRACIAQYGTLNIKGLVQQKTKLLSDDDDDEDDTNPVNYEVVGNLAIIAAKGHTLNESTFWTRYFGVTTYADIKERFNKAAEDPEVKGVLFRVNTPGGQAEGVGSLSAFINTFHDRIKPVVSHTSSGAYSAGYWYGTAGQGMVMDDDARVGSVGAIRVHFDLTEELKMEGIKPTVFRSGPYKALGTPYEKLDEKAKAQIMEDVMFHHNKFVVGLSGNLGLDEQTVRDDIANGKVFASKEALELGMVQNVLSFEETAGRLSVALEKQATRQFR